MKLSESLGIFKTNFPPMNTVEKQLLKITTRTDENNKTGKNLNSYLKKED